MRPTHPCTCMYACTRPVCQPLVVPLKVLHHLMEGELLGVAGAGKELHPLHQAIQRRLVVHQIVPSPRCLLELLERVGPARREKLLNQRLGRVGIDRHAGGEGPHALVQHVAPVREELAHLQHLWRVYARTCLDMHRHVHVDTYIYT